MRLNINHCAVSDHDGEISIAFNAEHSGASHVTSVGGGTVTCCRLDSYLEANGISEVALMKIDVEGYELIALRGCEDALKKKSIKAIYFEYC
jgi:FkbM family methyltransferase